MKIVRMLFYKKWISIMVVLTVGGLGLTYYSKAKYWYSSSGAGLVSQEKADIDAYDSTGMTGLMKAADRVDFDKVLWYLQQGANPNLQSKDKDVISNIYKGQERRYSPLHYVVMRGSFNQTPEVIKLLLENGADPHLRDYHGNTPLQTIFFTVDGLYQKQVLATLLAYGADPNAQNNDGNAFTHEAVENSNIAWITWVRKDFNSLVNLNLKNKKGYTPREYAIFLGQLDNANQGSDVLHTSLFKNPGVIIGADGNVQARDFMGNTALMLAIMRGDEAMVKMLLDKGAPLRATINPSDKPALQGNTALFTAILQQKPTMVRLLLEKCDVNDLGHKNRRGNTPLHVAMAIANQSVRRIVVDFLLKKGDELVFQNQLNVQNNDGETPFHAAIATGDVDLVRYLLTKYCKKIDLTIRNRAYKNAFEIANLLRQTPIAILIQRVQMTGVCPSAE